MKKINKRLGLAFGAIMLFATTVTPAFAQGSMNMSMGGNTGLQTAPNTQGQAQWFTDTISPLNSSGVHGFAKLKLQGNQLTVWMTATGFEPGQEHMQHIHGMTNGSNSMCPTVSANTDSDKTISLEEGLPFYGPVLQSLTPFQTPGMNGSEVYTNTFTVNTTDPTMDVLPLANREIVLHGMTLPASGDLNHPTAGYDASLPVACGHIMPMFGNNGGNGDSNGQKQNGSGVNISGNGAGSSNDVSVNNNHSSTTSQSNSSNVTNDVSIRSNTGRNISSENTGGITGISTGNSNSFVGISNLGGMNILDSMGAMKSGNSLSIRVNGNGSGSQNNVNFQSSNTSRVSQDNETRDSNDVHSNVNTGNNHSSDNTGGNTFLNTGTSMNTTSIFNGSGVNMLSH